MPDHALVSLVVTHLTLPIPFRSTDQSPEITRILSDALKGFARRRDPHSHLLGTGWLLDRPQSPSAVCLPVLPIPILWDS
ncbi:hypothetical protein FA13DRAFT_1739629 [Coprinellus micaceus]|uniref:Uncharacterized protein n=1 Tax=Coprinellus micaceus TaxID=71717 RepID=A0A4Y7SPM3_COPMI|nr:hypothetical protein FA13DRAFT_1739629 [Coprinellus micaceus]